MLHDAAEPVGWLVGYVGRRVEALNPLQRQIREPVSIFDTLCLATDDLKR